MQQKTGLIVLTVTILPNTMIFVSVTRLKVRSLWYLPGFMRANETSVRQLLKTPGFEGGKELVDKNLVFWTVTTWADEAAMKVFRNSAAHRKAMQKLPVWCNEASYLHWQQAETVLPDWQTIHGKMVWEGKLTKVRHPTAAQEGKNYPPVQWTKIQRPLKKR
jgi:hypothetical protein